MDRVFELHENRSRLPARFVAGDVRRIVVTANNFAGEIRDRFINGKLHHQILRRLKIAEPNKEVILLSETGTALVPFGKYASAEQRKGT